MVGIMRQYRKPNGIAIGGKLFEPSPVELKDEILKAMHEIIAEKIDEQYSDATPLGVEEQKNL